MNNQNTIHFIPRPIARGWERVLIFSLLLLCSFTVVAQPNPDGTYSAGSYETLKACVQNAIANGIPNATIKLTADIYLSDGAEETLCNTFRGTLDGNGHTIWAARPEVQHDGGGHYKRSYLFTNAEGATIKDLTFKDIREESSDYDNQAIIVQQATNGCIFENITFDNVSLWCKKNKGGAVAGYAANNCTFTNIIVKNSDFTVSGNYAGAVVGHAVGCHFTNIKVENCESTAENDRAGGITGHSENCEFNGVDASGGTIEAKDDNAGGVSGYADNCKFIHCVNSANVLGDHHVGGIVGYCTGTDFTRCDNSGTISHRAYREGFYTYEDLGGIVGHAEGGTIELCSNYGGCISDDYPCGGIVGYAKSMTINNCLCINTPTTERYSSGGIVGYCESCKVTNNVSTGFHCLGEKKYCKDMNPESGNNYYTYSPLAGAAMLISSPYEEKLTSYQMESGIVAYRLNNSRENLAAGIKPWRQRVGNSPSLDPQQPEATIDAMKEVYLPDWEYGGVPNVYRVSTPADLKSFADVVNERGNANAKCVLENDIYMAGTEYENWIPIGTPDHPFRGLFDGKGHIINGIKVNNDYAAGLFGYVGASAIIENVMLEDCVIVSNGEEGAGGIVGQYNLGKRVWGNILIRNCGSLGIITAPKHAGGIFGRYVPTSHDGDYSHNEHVSMRVYNCYTYADVTATSDGNSGLLCGYTRNTADVKNCWSVGSLESGNAEVTPYDTQHNEFFVGYLDKADITNCFALSPTTRVQGAGTNLSQSGVTNLTLEETANGRLAFEFNNNCDNTIVQQNIGIDRYPVHGNKGLYHAREASNQYGTICLPFLVKSDDRISYYTFKEATGDSDIKLKFEYVDEVEPGTPALFRAPWVEYEASFGVPVEIGFSNAGNEYVEAPNNPTTPHTWDFVGTFEQKVFETYNYVYYVSNNEIRNAKKITVPSYRAFFYGPEIEDLNGSNGTPAKTVTFVLEDEDGETTAVKLIYENDTLQPVLSQSKGYDNGKAYTIMGTEAPAGYKGIVIKNGKKVVIK